MTREDYLNYRSSNNPEPLYELYKEGFDEMKHKNFLNRGDFFQAIQMWPPAMTVLQNAISYYDNKFEVLVISDKETGRILKFV